MINVTGLTIQFADGGTEEAEVAIGEAAIVPFLTSSNLCPVGGPLDALVTGTVQAAL